MGKLGNIIGSIVLFCAVSYWGFKGSSFLVWYFISKQAEGMEPDQAAGLGFFAVFPTLFLWGVTLVAALIISILFYKMMKKDDDMIDDE